MSSEFPHRILLGKNIKVLRVLRSWSQEDLALEAGMSRSYLARVELGQQSVSVDIVARIAAAFEVPLDQLFKS